MVWWGFGCLSSYKYRLIVIDSCLILSKLFVVANTFSICSLLSDAEAAAADGGDVVYSCYMLQMTIEWQFPLERVGGPRKRSY